MKLAFIGLGVMGSPMAAHLAAAGHDVTVYNRSPAKALAWVEAHGGRAAQSAAEAVRDARIVFACVGNDDDLRDIMIGSKGGGEDYVLDTMMPEAIFVDHTTTSARIARTMFRAAQIRKVHFIDAPVSGGQSGAEAGTLSIMAGGDEEAFRHAQPVMAAYGKTIVHLGPSGAGQLAKMVNQICIAGVIAGLAEGLNFARLAGLDGEKLLSVISQGAAGSWQMANRAQTMLEDRFDFGFAIDLMIKDLGICLNEAEQNGCPLPLVTMVSEFYRTLTESGEGKLDTSALIKYLERKPAKIIPPSYLEKGEQPDFEMSKTETQLTSAALSWYEGSEKCS